MTDCRVDFDEAIGPYIHHVCPCAPATHETMYDTLHSPMGPKRRTVTPLLTGHLYSRRQRAQSGGAVTTIESWGYITSLLPGYVIDMISSDLREGAATAFEACLRMPAERSTSRRSSPRTRTDQGLTIDVAVFGDGPKIAQRPARRRGFAGSYQNDLIDVVTAADIQVV